ncbi:helix-turn-helix domain-containing protein [Alicyclobacillus hesperidum]|uniref:helix-turn-helix domain-containing protein n=1 Tax=Alicyclobacillus hesperidum TaxID=89784 RepID=UPI00116002B8|nr:helix-turn-helix domain-containing protein [Alicyclobacillus hesperidum]
MDHIKKHHEGTQGWIAFFQKLDFYDSQSWSNQIFVRLTPVYERVISCAAYELTETEQNRMEELSEEEKVQYLADLRTIKAEKRLEKLRKDGGSKLLIRPVKRSRQYTYQLNEITEELLLQWGMRDLYFVQNPSFVAGRRTENTVKEVRSLYVDLDILELTSMTVAQAWTKVRECFGVMVPTPNVVAFTGGGIHLVWWINPVSHYKVDLWKKIEARLIEIFQPYGVDTGVSDVVRVLRPDGSFNSKRGKTTEVLYLRAERYDLRQFGERVMPDWIPFEEWLSKHENQSKLSEEQEKPARAPSNVVPFTQRSSKASKRRKASTAKNESQPGHAEEPNKNVVVSFVPQAKKRLQDLETLREMGAFDGDRRRRAVFLYRVTALCAYESEKALEMTRSFNERLKSPLDDYVVECETRYAEIKRYWYSTEKIVDWLEITPKEQSGLQVLRLDCVSKSTRKQSSMTREEYVATAQERRRRIAELKAQGLSNRRIAGVLDCSEGEIRRLLKTSVTALNNTASGVNEEVRRVVSICAETEVVWSCTCVRCERVRHILREAARWWSSSPLPDDYVVLPIDEGAYTVAQGTEPCDSASVFLVTRLLPPDAPAVCKRYVAIKLSLVSPHDWTIEETRDLYLSVIAYVAQASNEEASAG